MSDCIAKVLDDCTRPPSTYLSEHGLLQPDYDQEQMTTRFAQSLVGRAVAILRDGSIYGCMRDGKNAYLLGSEVVRDNGRRGTVIGFAIGKNGERCLVLSMHDGHWRTYLCPVSEARPWVPSPGELREEIAKAMGEAASCDDYTPEKAEAIADRLLDMAHACFDK